MSSEYLYMKEYYKENKFIGYQAFVRKDREIMGYNGRFFEILNQDIVLFNKKTVKAGTEYMTMLYPMNLGKYPLSVRNS